MIWESVPAMMAIDLAIIAVIALAAAWILLRRRALLGFGILLQAALILLGLGLFGALHLSDLASMTVLPALMGPGPAMHFMEVLHLDVSWLVSLAGVGLISIGAVGALRVLMRANAALDREISDRRQMEQSLRESEQRFSEVLNLAMDGVISVDQDQNIILFNEGASKIFGYTAQEVLGGPLDFLLPEALRESHRGYIEGFSAEAETSRQMGAPGRVRGRRKDGSEFPAEASISRTSLEGTPIFTVLLRDISERVQAEEARKKLELGAQKARKMESLGVLAGGIAHDFNNLLMGILGNAELAKKKLSRDSLALENLEGINQASRRAAELCRQMLAYAGKGKFVTEAIDLNALIEETAHSPEVPGSKTAVFKFSLAQDVPFFQGDVAQIRQVVMNLIVNAAEAIGEKSGVIHFLTGAIHCDSDYLKENFPDGELAEGLHVSLEVNDTGRGMDAETLEKIFDPFFSTKFTGRGLGLSALLGIVQGHHGAVKVYSEPGRGTTFRLLFPADREAPVPPAAETVEEPDWKGTGTVLVIDDEQTVRAVAKEILELAGFAVLAARDGDIGVMVYREHQDDIVCILLDLTMPRMGGEEALGQLRRINGHVPIILSSGYTEREVIARFSGGSITGFIQKPYTPAALNQKLKDVLGG